MCVTPTGSEALAKRLSVLIEQGLVKTKATASGVGAFGGADALAAAFARALRLVSRHPSGAVQRAAGLVTAYLHRAALQAPAELRAVALESLKTAATLLLASRKARLQHKYFAGVLERVPSLAAPTAAAVLDGLAAARNGDHIRLEAALVLQAAVKVLLGWFFSWFVEGVLDKTALCVLVLSDSSTQSTNGCPVLSPSSAGKLPRGDRGHRGARRAI